MQTADCAISKEMQFVSTTANSQKNAIAKKFDYNLEGLRGIAALFVVVGHLIYHNSYLDPKFFPGVLYYFNTNGHFCVLIFFVLSGYVIGVSNKRKLQGKEILVYLKKRWIRLFPIFCISMLLTLVISPINYSFSTFIANLSFTQLFFNIPVIWENNPIWSLQYEVIFYLLFIPISYFNINLLTLILASFLIGLENYFLYPNFSIPSITSISFGFTFWALGLAIAKYETYKELKTNFSLLISAIFLFLSLDSLNFFSILLAQFCTLFIDNSIQFPGTVEWYNKMISFADFALLPYCIMFVFLFTGKQFKYRSQVFLILQLLPLLTLIYLIKNPDDVDKNELIISTVYFLTSLIFYFFNIAWLKRFSQRVISVSIWLGSISYAIYIIHFPILVIFKRVEVFSGSYITYLIRLLFFFGLLIASAFCLEKKLQPWIKNKLIKQ